ncbi:hypothetical protein ACV229_36955 [Burkholderia sp. MR1-5-21]
MDAQKTGDTGPVMDEWASDLEVNVEVVSRIGARMVVLCKFVDAVLPQLNAAQCREIERLFRHGVEDAMSYADDIPLLGTYQRTLLEQTNVLLIALGHKGANRH